MRTLIEGGWVVGFRGRGHELIADGAVVFEDDTIQYVGHHYDGHFDRRIDARGKLVTPGFIDSHVHSGHRAIHRLLSDTGRPEFLGQPFYEVNMPRIGAAVGGDPRHAAGAGYAVQAEFTLAELLRNGITTFVEFGSGGKMQDAMLFHAERLGNRAYLGPGYESGQLVTNEAGRRHRIMDAAKGERHLAEALAFIDANDGRGNGRIRGVLVPREVDTCTVALLQRTAEVAAERDLPVATHVAYNPWEVYETIAAHGCTPVELLERVGLLRPKAILGHCNFIACDGRMHYPGGRDLEILAGSGATVSHCPINLMRRGRHLDHWGRYRAAGVPIALGTDTYPRDMIMLMRSASYMGKMTAQDLFVAPAPEVFEAATLAGARMLGRDDLGRLAPGAKADIVIIDIEGRDHLRFAPVRDPIRSLVECGVGDDVETVIVDGRVCVANREVLGVDLKALRAAVQQDSERIWGSVADWDPLGRSAEERNPWSFPLRTPEP